MACAWRSRISADGAVFQKKKNLFAGKEMHWRWRKSQTIQLLTQLAIF